MELIVNKKVITAPISVILHTLKNEINGKYLNYIGPEKGDDIAITCPWHKDGQENRPSCHVFTKRDDSTIYYGTVHCFTCGKSVPLYSLIGYYLEGDDDLGKEWLVERFGGVFLKEETYLPEIIIDKKKKDYLNESILDDYNYYHPYMDQRKLTPQVISLFKIGYDKETDSLTFPVWDENNHLVTITRRSVKGKKFILEENIDKPVYLLNFIKSWNFQLFNKRESENL